MTGQKQSIMPTGGRAAETLPIMTLSILEGIAPTLHPNAYMPEAG